MATHPIPSGSPDRREEWEKAKQSRDEARDNERWELEKDKGRWEKNGFVKLLLPLALTGIAGAQLIVAALEHTSNEAQKALNYEKSVAQFVDLALQHRQEIESPDPRKKCGFFKYISAVDGYSKAAGKLNVDASMCSSPAEFATAIRNFEAAQANALNPFREGAPQSQGAVRRNPATGQLFVSNCVVPARTNAGNVSGTCALPTDTPQSATIYRVEYSCTDPRCGWSYNQDSSKGYQPDVSPPGGRSIEWRRRWGGDEHIETYSLYYQIADRDAQALLQASNSQR